jgi:hypothetical protein
MGGQAVSFGVASSAVLGDKENLLIVVYFFIQKYWAGSQLLMKV